MKTPHGFVYAILITVAIVAVTIFARSQSSSFVPTPAVRTPPPESATESAGADSKDESDAKEANPKPNDDAAK